MGLLSAFGGALDPARRLRSLDWSALEGLGPRVSTAAAKLLAGASAERVIDRFLRDHRDFTSPQRAAAVEALFGLALWRRRLAAHAGLPWSDGSATAALPPHAPELICALLRELAGLDEPRAISLSGAARAPPRGEAGAPAERFSLPDWLWAEFVAQLGEPSARAFADAICQPGPIFLRANRARISREQLGVALGREGIQSEPCAFAPDGLRLLSPRPNLLASHTFRAGLFEVQDEGSQLLGELLEAREGDSVLDVCAGAGGKSLQLAAAVGAGGRVVCTDPDRSRLARLEQRARRAQAPAIERTGALPDGLRAARVLADAPCSELGVLRRGPDARFRLDPSTPRDLPALQLEILRGAADRVLPGGRLVYATCTIRREENEEVALAFERAQRGFARVRPCLTTLDERFFPRGELFFRALPHLHGTDGFFAASWQRER